jgi:hypothetical protein
MVDHVEAYPCVEIAAVFEVLGVVKGCLLAVLLLLLLLIVASLALQVPS